MSFFTKRIQELEEADIQFLINNDVRESVQLEFKQALDTSNEAKKMLCRQVSALANSQGGYLIVGVTEDDGVADAINGIPKTVDSTKTEEWVEQVLNSNITQRVAPLVMKVIDIETDPDNMVLVIHVPLSPRAPHMVTFGVENRYYVRHNTQTSRAEEYEVRDIFVRSERMYDRTMRYLEARNYVDPDSDMFGENRWTQKLVFQSGTSVDRQATSFYTFLCLPVVLSEDVVETANPELHQWLQNGSNRRYEPLPGRSFLPDYLRVTFEGLVLAKYNTSWKIVKYLLINRNGHLEYGSTGGIQVTRSPPSLSINFLKTDFERFLRFTKDFFDHPNVHYSGSLKILFNFIGLDDLEAAEWSAQPDDLDSPIYPSPNIQLLYEVALSELPSKIEAMVSNAHLRLANAFGFPSPP